MSAAPGRLEAADKVTGRARYAGDIRLPGQLYAAVLRSSHAHARIARLSTAAAEALPGVRGVLSHANAPDIAWGRGKLFDRHLRFVGDEVAAVVADSMDIAAQAMDLIRVEYRVLPCVLGAEAALAPDAPAVQDGGNRAGLPEIDTRGNVRQGFRQAEVILEQTYTTQTALHNCLEPHGCTASWRGGQLTVWESTQGIYAVRDALAETLGLPAHRVRVVARHIGAGFGSKLALGKHTVIAALLSKAARRPVQLLLDREAENLATGNRAGTRQRVKLGAKRDGVLTAMEAHILVAIGADEAGGETSDVASIYRQLYRCRNLRTEQTRVFTNTGPSCAFRAPGHVEGAFGLESAMDELARQLGMDPLELRLRNYAERDQQRQRPWSAPEALRRCSARAAEAFGWHGFERPPPSGGRFRGIGVAAHEWSGGRSQPPAYAWIKLNHDGSAEVITGSQDIGTGTRTALAQIAAEELGITLDRVAIRIGDTLAGPYAPASGGSATLATVGPAVRAAAANARRALLEAAADHYRLPRIAEARVGQGHIEVPGSSQRIAIADVTSKLRPAVLLGHGECPSGGSETSVHTFGVQCVEVEVDTETAEVSVLRVVAAHDCGRIVNRALTRSQVIGGVTQGLGFALMEERVLDPNSGIVLNANLEDYKVPTVADAPLIVHAEVDDPDYGANPIGAKGIGEPPIIPTAPAVANAVHDAIGLRLRHAPLSRRRLLASLGIGEEGRDEALRI